MTTAFIDESVDCAICFESFHGAHEETITLTCGHKWHLACLRQQLEHARPDRTRRLLFSGCRCAKCGTFCDHPALEHWTRRTDGLREKVDALVAEQIKVDAPEAWTAAVLIGGIAGRDAVARLLDQGRRDYAFYLCGACDEPYFGGAVECIAGGEEAELRSGEDRLCSTCSPKPATVCRTPSEHGAFHVWKCRYCCNPSRFVCYGNVHFCTECHERNTEWVKAQRNGQRWRRRDEGDSTPHLKAIPCCGDSCRHPKLEGCDKHANGSSRDCEQVYYCAWCASNPLGRNVVAEEEPGSRNFIVNPSGEDGTRGWNAIGRHNIYTKWNVETAEVPVDGNTHTNFVSSYSWCIMAQKVPLHKYVRDPSSAHIEVSAKFMGRTDCPSVFKMEAVVTNSTRRVLHRVETSELVSPVDFWEKVSLTIDPVENAHDVTMGLYGKDQRFWCHLWRG